MRSRNRPLTWGNAFASSTPAGAANKSVDAFLAESRQFTDRMFAEWIAESRSLASRILDTARDALSTTGPIPR